MIFIGVQVAIKKIWFEEAWDDYVFWQQQDKKTLRRINQLIKDLLKTQLKIRKYYFGMGITLERLLMKQILKMFLLLLVYSSELFRLFWAFGIGFEEKSEKLIMLFLCFVLSIWK